MLLISVKIIKKKHLYYTIEPTIKKKCDIQNSHNDIHADFAKG